MEPIECLHEQFESVFSEVPGDALLDFKIEDDDWQLLKNDADLSDLIGTVLRTGGHFHIREHLEEVEDSSTTPDPLRDDLNTTCNSPEPEVTIDEIASGRSSAGAKSLHVQHQEQEHASFKISKNNVDIVKEAKENPEQSEEPAVSDSANKLDIPRGGNDLWSRFAIKDKVPALENVKTTVESSTKIVNVDFMPLSVHTAALSRSSSSSGEQDSNTKVSDATNIKEATFREGDSSSWGSTRSRSPSVSADVARSDWGNSSNNIEDWNQAQKHHDVHPMEGDNKKLNRSAPVELPGLESLHSEKIEESLGEVAQNENLGWKTSNEEDELLDFRASPRSLSREELVVEPSRNHNDGWVQHKSDGVHQNSRSQSREDSVVEASTKQNDGWGEHERSEISRSSSSQSRELVEASMDQKDGWGQPNNKNISINDRSQFDEARKSELTQPPAESTTDIGWGQAHSADNQTVDSGWGNASNVVAGNSWGSLDKINSIEGDQSNKLDSWATSANPRQEDVAENSKSRFEAFGDQEGKQFRKESGGITSFSRKENEKMNSKENLFANSDKWNESTKHPKLRSSKTGWDDVKATVSSDRSYNAHGDESCRYVDRNVNGLGDRLDRNEGRYGNCKDREQDNRRKNGDDRGAPRYSNFDDRHNRDNDRHGGYSKKFDRDDNGRDNWTNPKSSRDDQWKSNAYERLEKSLGGRIESRKDRNGSYEEETNAYQCKEKQKDRYGEGKERDPHDRYEDSRGREIRASRYSGNEDDSRFRKTERSGRRESSRSNENWGEPDREKAEIEESAASRRNPGQSRYHRLELKESELFSSGVTQGINFSKFDKIPVKFTGPDAPAPIRHFSDVDLPMSVIDNIRLSHYTKPTPVQQYGIPALLKQRDLMVCAETGSGKTAAFLIPIVTMLLKNRKGGAKDPSVLILAPTRELAIQIYDESRKFCYMTDIKPRVAYGGAPSTMQMLELNAGCDILIATPGRLIDFVNKDVVSLNNVKYFILDEADKMLEMGFDEQVKNIVRVIPHSETRQSFMFSATFPPPIQKLAAEYLKNDYLFLSIGKVGSACENIEQEVICVEKYEKKRALLKVLKNVGRQRVVIFVRTKRDADYIDDLLFENGLPCTSIHGDRSQSQRESALNIFKLGKTPIMIATDVAARGLDIPNVNLVIVYDLGDSIMNYIHRIGRTGRAGNTGRSMVFFDPNDDRDMAEKLVDVLQRSGQPIPEFLSDVSKGGGGVVRSSGFARDNYQNRDDRDQYRHSKTSYVRHDRDQDDYNGGRGGGDGYGRKRDEDPFISRSYRSKDRRY